MKNKLYKIIALVLVILTIIYCPLTSYSNANQAYASATLTAVAIKALTILVPLVATYVAYNWYGANYSQSQLATITNKINEAQDIFVKVVPTFALLAFAQVYNNCKNIASNVSELAHSIDVYNKETISKAESLANTMSAKVATGESFTFSDFFSTGILGAILYYYAKIFKLNDVAITLLPNTNNLYYNSIPYPITTTNELNLDLFNQILKTNYVITTSQSLLNYTNRYKSVNNTSFIIDICIELANLNKTQNIINDFTNITKVTFMLSTKDNIFINQRSYYIGDNSQLLSLLKFIFESALGLGSAESNIRAQNFIDSGKSIFDLLNISLFLNNPLTIALPIAKDKPIAFVAPTGTDIISICNDGVVGQNFWDREKATADTNIYENADGTTGISADIPKDKSGTPITGAPAKDIPNIDAFPDTSPDSNETISDPSGDNILDWLKSFWKSLLKLLSFQWLKDMISAIISAMTNLLNLFRDSGDSTIDWGKFKGFFDIFIILIFLILIVFKIFLKLLGAAASLLGITASDTFFKQYPNILVGVEYIKNINVPGINQPVITVLTYMFGVFFIIYIAKIIQTIYHAFTRQEDLEVRDAEREVRANNRVVDQNQRYEQKKQRNMNHAKSRATINSMSDNDNSIF